MFEILKARRFTTLTCPFRGGFAVLQAGNSQLTAALKSPGPGHFVEVRARRWLVESSTDEGDNRLRVLSLSCIDDDSQGEQLSVVWDDPADIIGKSEE